MLNNKTILVTGGTGSFGKCFTKYVLKNYNPKKIIIYSRDEFKQWMMANEFKEYADKLRFFIGDVRDLARMKRAFVGVDYVIHAAAMKQVPACEYNPNEAIKTNIEGAQNVIEAALDSDTVKKVVALSTDKAVNPTNIMGATKRICEMIIQTIGRHSEKTKFVAVRFGNVLGSNGSVVPLFKKQIAEGGPVTVTHKDIIRYFMTIPEAVSLVLQAGAYAKGGQIFVLDMGEPVRIYDLAYNLIKLSGLEPNVDIEIKCTGLRPGEKLFEERLMDEEGLQKTPNGLINIAQPIKFNEEDFWGTMDNLYTAAYNETDEMKKLVKELVPTYKIDERSF